MFAAAFRHPFVAVLCAAGCFLLCGVCLSADGAKDTPAKPAGTVIRQFEANADAALQAMQDKAEGLKIKGAAVIAFIPGEKTTGWVSHMRVVGEFVLGKNNVLGVAYSKAAEMADTLKNSGGGERPPYKGEYGYKGGAIREIDGGYLLAAFSGGPSEDDLKVAEAGIEHMAKSLSEPGGK
jgi:hypothetical protein